MNSMITHLLLFEHRVVHHSDTHYNIWCTLKFSCLREVQNSANVEELSSKHFLKRHLCKKNFLQLFLDKCFVFWPVNRCLALADAKRTQSFFYWSFISWSSKKGPIRQHKICSKKVLKNARTKEGWKWNVKVKIFTFLTCDQ